MSACISSSKMEDHTPRSRSVHQQHSSKAGTNASLNHANNGRKHGFSISRFSLRRFLNPASYSRTTTLSNKRASQQQFKDSHSESGSAADNKSVSNVKATSFCPTYSSLDFESTSICSGRSDMIQPETSNFRLCSNGAGISGGGRLECPLCLLEMPSECFPELTTCSHRACFECMQKYLKIEICESRVNISCPECTEPIHPNDIRMILNDEVLLTKYELFMLRRVLVAEPDARWCPAPDCSYVVVASGCASCPKLKCGRPGCDTSFCYHCKQEWHPNQTCDAARAQRNHSLPYSQKPRASSVTFSHDSVTQRDDIKPCPCCKVLVIKMDDGSCNHMTCCVCGTEFCWLCMKEISDLHYLSPSGCTFWGKKPWSRKKKILWQLGMLIGAPVGIALIAGIAVPAIIIGIPVWVGRKLHARFQKQPSMSKPNKNLLVTTGVLTSILVSPILAAVAVGIGVPILLAYVYGVVPISLCRSGGCGVSTSPSGVRIELDEENDIGLNTSNPPDAVSVDTTLTAKGVNPSIDGVSFGMSTSLSMGSGTHLDRTGADRESASNAALAGSIASANACIGGTTKLDVQSDSLSNKRYSLSSHSETASATVSLSERSANLSLGDDASTKALAGSIVGYRDVCIGTSSLATAVTPVEVHVDAVSIMCNNEHSPCCCDDTASNSGATETLNTVAALHRQIAQKVSESNSSTDIGDASSQSGWSKMVSFHSDAKSKISKYESRSLEQLTNYCEVCNKTHRPCCPNYSNGYKNNAQSSRSDKHRNRSGVEECPRKKAGVKSNAKSSQYDGNRKGSIKSTHSDTTPVAKKHLEIKRVKSSDSNQTRSKKCSSRNVAKSTPTSPIGKITETSSPESKDSHIERAYPSSNNPMGNYSQQFKKTKALYTAIDLDKCLS